MAKASAPQTIPELTLERVISGGLGSDSFSILQTERLNSEAIKLRAQAPLDAYARFETTVVDDENEPTSPFSTQSTQSRVHQFEVGKAFSTGTQLTTQLRHGDSRLDFSTMPTVINRQSGVTVSLSQKLWRDGLGRATRNRLRSAELQGQANELLIDEGAVDWMLGYTEVFYGSWLFQARARQSADSVERKRRLLQITSLKLARGTAERPDYLQVKKNLLQAESGREEVEQSLREAWNGLVLSLRLPAEWLKFDPVKVPLTLDDPVIEAEVSCKASEAMAPTDVSSVRRHSLQLQASQAQLVNAKNAFAPDLQFKVSYEANGVDVSDRGETVDEILAMKNPAWSLGLALTMPLERAQEEADYRQALGREKRAELELAQLRSDRDLEWLNHCQNFRRWQKRQADWQKAYSEQEERLQLEEQRYRLGRVPVLNVIQAGDEASEAFLEARRADVELRLEAWRIHRLSGRSERFLKDLVAKARR